LTGTLDDSNAFWMCLKSFVIDNMHNYKISLGLSVGLAIATTGFALPTRAVPAQTLMVVAQTACVVRKTTPVFTTANPQDSEVLPILPLSPGTPVGFAAPLPVAPPPRVQITNPNGFVDYAALNCGGAVQSPSACRRVRSTLNSAYIFREPNWGANPVGQVTANQTVYVNQVSGKVFTQTDPNGLVWLQVNLQRTFGRNFGIPSGAGWLPNQDPGDVGATLVYCN